MTVGPQIVAQRLVLVLPSTGTFDSRTWGIARTAAGRGHDVTVIARRGDGLPDQETARDGFRVIRVPWDAVDGLPRGIRGLARALRRRRQVPPPTPHAASGSADPASPRSG